MEQPHRERKRSEVLDAFGGHLIEAATDIRLEDLRPDEDGGQLRLDVTVAIDADSLAEIVGAPYARELLGNPEADR